MKDNQEISSLEKGRNTVYIFCFILPHLFSDILLYIYAPTSSYNCARFITVWMRSDKELKRNEYVSYHRRRRYYPLKRRAFQ